MNLEDITPNEISQSQKDAHRILPFLQEVTREVNFERQKGEW